MNLPPGSVAAAIEVLPSQIVASNPLFRASVTVPAQVARRVTVAGGASSVPAFPRTPEEASPRSSASVPRTAPAPVRRSVEPVVAVEPTEVLSHLFGLRSAIGESFLSGPPPRHQKRAKGDDNDREPRDVKSSMLAAAQAISEPKKNQAERKSKAARHEKPAAILGDHDSALVSRCGRVEITRPRLTTPRIGRPYITAGVNERPG